MPREIKLRVITEDGSWLYWDAKDAGNDCCYYLSDERKEGTDIQQFTGLHDITSWDDLSEEEKKEWSWKNIDNEEIAWKGKEIWEGDIVLYYRRPYLVKFGKYWNAGEYDDCVYRVSGYGFYIERSCEIEDLCDIEEIKVIGNIYENPELLKK